MTGSGNPGGTLPRRCLLLGVAMALGVLALLAAAPAGAQAYPDRAVRIIVPFAAGGGVDNITRAVSTPLSVRLRQPVVVENRPGANANIGSDAVAKSAPDGYTLLMGATYLGFNRATSKNLTYDAATDLVPIARTGRAPQVLAVPVNGPRTVAELVAWMKANPDKSSYGAVGAGSPVHLLFVRHTGTAPVQVLYKGGSAAMPDLIEGRLTYMIQTASEILPHVASGRLRALAVTGATRMRALPDVPTMAEAGVPNLDIVGWWGLFAPAKTPAAAIERLAADMQAVLAQPDVVRALEQMGIESAPLGAADFAAFYRQELDAYVRVAKEFDLKGD